MDEKPFSACDARLQPLRKYQDPNLLLNGGFFMPESNTASRRSPAAGSTRLRVIVLLAMLTAMEVVLNRFLSINTPYLKIGFSFVPVVAAAILCGPLGGACVGALGDLIGAILFPNGPFFPGFTATALLTGLVYGLFLYKKQTPLRIVLAVAVNQLLLSLLLNTLWLTILWSGTEKAAPYFTILATRIGQCALLIPIQYILIQILAPALKRLKQL